MYYANAAEAFLISDGKMSFPGKALPVSFPLPWDTAPTGNQTLSPLGSSDVSLAPGLLFQLSFLQEESPGMI